MRPFAALERFLERLFERPSARLLGARLEPVTLARRLERAMDESAARRRRWHAGAHAVRSPGLPGATSTPSRASRRSRTTSPLPPSITRGAAVTGSRSDRSSRSSGRPSSRRATSA